VAEEHKDSNTPLSDMGLFRHTSKFIHSEQDNRDLTAYQTGGNKLSKIPKVKASNAYNLTPTEDAAAAIENDKRFSSEVLKSKNIKCFNSRRNKFVAIATQIPLIQARQHVSPNAQNAQYVIIMDTWSRSACRVTLLMVYLPTRI